MLFSDAGRTYDTNTMGHYPLPDFGAIYIDHEHRLVFVQLQGPNEQMVIHRATRTELEACASKFLLPELLTYLNWF